VTTIEQRQGIKAMSPEEIAFGLVFMSTRLRLHHVPGAGT
jgi:hypothetical protein